MSLELRDFNLVELAWRKGRRCSGVGLQSKSFARGGGLKLPSL